MSQTIVNNQNISTFHEAKTGLSSGLSEEVLFLLLEEAQNPSKPSKKGKGTKGTSESQKTEGGRALPSGIPKGLGVFGMVFFLLLDAMTTRQETVTVISKGVTLNASIQKKLNKENEAINFSVLPDGAKSATIARVQDKNEEYAAERENIQSELVTARMEGQKQMTNADTNISILEQNAAENSGWLKTLNTIFQVISSMIKPI